MVVIPNDDDTTKMPHKAGSEPVAVIRSADSDASDPPPDYNLVARNAQAGPSSAADATGLSLSLPPDLQPSNFMTLSRSNASISGKWLIDPSLTVAHPFLPPLADGETEETRKNISLHTNNGSINADLFVAPPRTDAIPKHSHVRIHAFSKNGSVTTKVREVQHPGDPAYQPRQPYYITSHSSNGAIRLWIPRSFRGPVRLHTKNGSIKFSDAVKARVTTFHEVAGVMRVFIGRFDPSEFKENDKWRGDEMDGESYNGSISIHYEDEDRGPGKKGFFEKITMFFD